MHFNIAPPRLLESSKNLGWDILWSILAHKWVLEKVVKVTIKENKVIVIENVNIKIYIEVNLEEKIEREKVKNKLRVQIHEF